MTISMSTELHVLTCPKCSGVFAITEVYRAEAAREGGFKQCRSCPYCKNSRGYGEGEVDRLRKELANAEQEKERLNKRATYFQQERDKATQEAEHFRKSRDGVRGAMASQKKRIANGVCPCCQRTFVNLHRHMTSKHPAFAKPEEESK